MHKQSIPIAKIISSEEKNNTKNISSSSLKLVQFVADDAIGVINETKVGTNSIVIRSDIYDDLSRIKYILNSHEISFSCKFIDVSLKNKYISDLARLGLEISLNYDAGLTKKTNFYLDDYLIGPDKSRPLGNNFNLRVYAPIRRKYTQVDFIYKPIEMPLELYDIKNTYMKAPPEIKKIIRPSLDLSKIMSDYRFYPIKPEKIFFDKSDNLASNWYKFYRIDGLNVGDSYAENLLKIYQNRGESIWNDSKLRWDGERFTWNNS